MVRFIFIAIALVVAMGGFVYGNRQMASCEDTVGRLDPPELHDRHLHGFERAVQLRECRQSRRRADSHCHDFHLFGDVCCLFQCHDVGGIIRASPLLHALKGLSFCRLLPVGRGSRLVADHACCAGEHQLAVLCGFHRNKSDRRCGPSPFPSRDGKTSFK